MNRVLADHLRLAGKLDEFVGIIRHQMLVAPNDPEAFDPMGDRRSVPGPQYQFLYAGWVSGVENQSVGFDPERFERAGLRGHCLLTDDLGSARPVPGDTSFGID